MADASGAHHRVNRNATRISMTLAHSSFVRMIKLAYPVHAIA